MRVVIPIEIQVRELDGRIWLALHLLQNGHNVVLGKTPAIDRSMDVLDPDIIFTSTDHFRKHLTDTTGTAYLDMEGSAFSSRTRDGYYDRITPEPANSVETFFAWGSKTGEIARKAGCKNVIVSGNPRFDLLHRDLKNIYSDRTELIRTEYEPFILVNTSFSKGNYENDEPLSEQDRPSRIEDTKDWQQDMAVQFIELISRMSSSINDTKIVIRPHPAENHDTYHIAFDDDESVHVRHEGDVRPWIIASEAVVHNGCTTGIESALLETPTLAYTPENNDFTPFLPNFVSTEIDNAEQLIDELIDIIQGDNVRHELNSSQKSELKKHFHNIDCRAAPIIADAVSGMAPKQNNHFSPTPEDRIKRAATAFLGDKNITRIRKTGLREHWTYTNQKYPYISTDEFKQRVNQFKPFIDLPDITIKRIRRFENTFLLEVNE